MENDSVIRTIECRAARPARNNHFLPVLILVCLTQATACSSRDASLEAKISTQLREFKNGNETVLDLSKVLGNNWRKVCVQSPYKSTEAFNDDSSEGVSALEDITENQIAIWIFYKDGSEKAAVLERSSIGIVHFGAYRTNSGAAIICAPSDKPFLYKGHDIFYFKG